MSKRWMLAAAVVAVLAVMGLAVALLTPGHHDNPTMGGMGSTGMQTASSYNMVLIALASIALVVAVTLIVLAALAGENAPRGNPQPFPPVPEALPSHQAAEVWSEEPRATTPVADANADNAETLEGQPRNYLILRLLTEDEKMMYKTIMDAGGAALQRDLILSTRMSKAKVTRVLDKLQSKGLVTRERHASTNMVKIKT